MNELEQRAEAIGREQGGAAGSWIVDGNSDEGTLRNIVRMAEEGTFFDLLPDASGPLSGEWAGGYSPRQLVEDCGVELGPEDEDLERDLCDAYEDAYWTALEDRAVADAKAMLPDAPEDDERKKEAVMNKHDAINVQVPRTLEEAAVLAERVLRMNPRTKPQTFHLLADALAVYVKDAR